MDPIPETAKPGEDNIFAEAAEEGEWQVAETAEPEEPAAAEEAKQEGEGEEPAPESQTWDDFEWDGNPENLPKPLQRTHRDLVRGAQAKYRDIAELRKQLEEAIRAASQPQTPQATAPQEPPQIDTTDETTYARSLEKRIQWEIDQRLAKVKEQYDPKVQQVEATTQQLQQQMEQAEFQRLIGQLEADPEWSPAVKQRMIEIADSDPFWRDVPPSPAAYKRLFKEAVSQHKEAQKARQEAQRKTGAAKRAVARPSGQGVTKKAEPSDKYSGTIEEIGRRVLQESGYDPWKPLPD